MKYLKTINILQQYPSEIIIWRKKMFDREEMIELVKKLAESDKKVPEEVLQKHILRALKHTSGWVPPEHVKEKVDWETALEDMLK